MAKAVWQPWPRLGPNYRRTAVSQTSFGTILRDFKFSKTISRASLHGNCKVKGELGANPGMLRWRKVEMNLPSEKRTKSCVADDTLSHASGTFHGNVGPDGGRSGRGSYERNGGNRAYCFLFPEPKKEICKALLACVKEREGRHR